MYRSPDYIGPNISLSGASGSSPYQKLALTSATSSRLSCPLPSLSNMLKHMINIYGIKIKSVQNFISFVYGSEYMTDKKIMTIGKNTNIVITHSMTDEVIPFNEGIKLYNVVAESHPYCKFLVSTGTHNKMGYSDKFIYEIVNAAR